MLQVELENKHGRNSTKIQYVTFYLGKEKYGINIKKANEIIKPPRITGVPNTEEYVMGVINLRGQIVPIIDLFRKFGIEQSDTKGRIITVKTKDYFVGLRVERTDEVVWINTDEIEPAPEQKGKVKEEYLKGVGNVDNELVIVIDVDKILADRTEE